MYGYRYDLLLGEPVGPALEPQRITVSRDQWKAVTSEDPLVQEVFCLGPPSSGKTYTLRAYLLRRIAEMPNGVGGLMAPTASGVKLVFQEIIPLLESFGWLRNYSSGSLVLETVNNHRIEGASAERGSKRHGTGAQGRSWLYAVGDEVQAWQEYSRRELLARGRRLGKAYKVFYSATMVNENPDWDVRLDQAESDPSCKVYRMPGPGNPFVPASHWEAERQRTDDSTWRRVYLLEKVPPEDRAYPEYTTSESVRPVGRLPGEDFDDVTRDFTKDWFWRRYQQRTEGWEWILGHDPGRMKTATTALKVFRSQQTNRLAWWVLWEWLAHDYRTQDQHFGRVATVVSPSDALLFVDPGENGDWERDRRLIESVGFKVNRPYGRAIPRAWRVSVVKRLLCTADGTRQLYLAERPGELGRVAPYKLAGALLTVTADQERYGMAKNSRDLTDLTSALAYAVFPFHSDLGIQPSEAVLEARKNVVYPSAIRRAY